MAPLSSTASLVRRLGDADRPVLPVAAMVAASVLLLVAVLVALPSPAEGSDSEPVVDVPVAATSTSTLLEGPTQVVLPMPDADGSTARVLVNHRAADVEVTARMANGDGLAVELAEAGSRSSAVSVTSERVHHCGRYAGTLILEATHARLASDLLVLDVRFAECGDTEAITMAPDSVNDLEPTWADDGTAPWKTPTPGVPVPPTPTETEPSETESTTPSPQPEPSTQRPEPTPDPTTATPTPEPTSTAPDPTPTSEPEPTTSPTSEPEPTPTSEPEPTSSPSPTSEPEPTSSPSPTSDPEPSPTSTEGGGGTEDGGASPSPSPTSTEG